MKIYIYIYIYVIQRIFIYNDLIVIVSSVMVVLFYMHRVMAWWGVYIYVGGEGLGLRGDCVGEVVFLSFVFTCKK